MGDYAELVKALRCCSKIDARNNGCDSCPYEYCGDDCQNLCGYAADAIEELLDELTTIRKQLPHWFSIETNIFDQEENHPNCTVQILKNSVTGEISIGWWPNKEDDNDKTVCE